MDIYADHSRRKIIVFKFGSSTLTGGGDHLDQAFMVDIVRQIHQLRSKGWLPIIVSSGAIAAGRGLIGHRFVHHETVAQKQLLAAVGQSTLIQTWEKLFSIYGLITGQMLLTRADLTDRERFLNARDLLCECLDQGIIPVINENDAVATAEIKVGDNDQLSALVAILAGAQRLVLLTDQKGLYTADPRTSSHAQLIHEVSDVTPSILRIAGDGGAQGTGGMYTKLLAASTAQRAGIEVIICDGRSDMILQHSTLTPSPGTRFIPSKSPLTARKQWILAGPSPTGMISIDDGAVQALINDRKSLLPKGVITISGDFNRGSLLEIFNSKDLLIGRGLSRYSYQELKQIIGIHSRDIKSILGYDCGPAVIHRDDWVSITLSEESSVNEA